MQKMVQTYPKVNSSSYSLASCHPRDKFPVEDYIITSENIGVWREQKGLKYMKNSFFIGMYAVSQFSSDSKWEEPEVLFVLTELYMLTAL